MFIDLGSQQVRFADAVVRVVSVAVLMAIAGAQAQQPYPGKPIRLISPFAPGGGNDILARLVARKLTETWGQPVIVDNRPGANTIIGTEALVKAPPDGYTLILVGSSHVINPSLLPNLPYDIIKDFAPVATLGGAEQVLVLHPGVPANTLQEFIALAKSKPGQLNYSSAGKGTTNNLSAELFNILAGVTTQHIPYKGTGPALADLVSGHVQLSFSPTNSAIPYIKSGKFKGIAVSGAKRLPALPQVPTFSEAGLPGFDARNWYGILAPADAPRQVIDKLSLEIGRIVTMPDFREKLASLGMDPLISTPNQFATLLKADLARYAKIIKTANIKIE